MFFLASQVVGFFAVPSTCALVACALGLILLQTRYASLGRKVASAGIIVLLSFALLPIGDALTLPLESRFPQWRESAGGTPTGVIVLGGAIDPGMSAVHRQVSLNGAAERLTEAAQLARRFPDARVVFSSGFGSARGGTMREADFAADLLTGLGLERQRLVLERESRDTFENGLFTRRIVKLKPGDRWLLVTSATHMPRAMGVFRRLGFNVEAYPVDYQTGRWRGLARFPIPLRNLRLVDQAVHEWLGLLAYRLNGRTAALFPGP